MSIRKRKWKTARGVECEAWVVDYTDQQGERRQKTVATKKEAGAWSVTARHEVQQGIHTADSKSITVAQAADDWIAYVKLEGRERSTTEQYERHVHLHIVPRLGREKLARLTTPRINKFRDELLTTMSRATARKVLVSLKAILRDAKRRGNLAQNVAADVRIASDQREKQKLRVGVDIPTPDEIKRIISAATGKARVFLLTVTFTGLRSSELRGLRWDDVDLKRGELHVRQRADRYNVMGKPKSQAGERTIPIGPAVVNALREWKLACPNGELGLVFPNTLGKFADHANIVQRILSPPQIAAAVTVAAKDEDGKPTVEAKYTGLHALRHFYASWCINRKADGGLELPLKVVQERLGKRHNNLRRIRAL